MVYMQLKNKLISNTTYLFFNWFALALLSFVFWVVLGKTLPKAELGIVSTAINFVLLISWFVDLGVGFALQKLIPEIKRKMGLKAAYSLIRLAIKPAFLTLTCISIFLFVISNWLSVFLKFDYSVVLISILSLVSIALFNFFGSVLYGFQNMKKYFITNLVHISIRVALSVILIFMGLSYFGPLVAFCLAFLCAAFLRMSFTYFKSDKVKFPYKMLFEYSFPTVVSSLAISLIYNSQYIILTVIKNPEATGIFTIAFVITSPLLVLSNVLTSALFPVISELSYDHRTKSKQGYLIGLVLRYSLFLIIPLSALLIIFSKYAVLMFSSAQYLQSTLYFPLLVPAAILYGLGGIFNSNIYAIGKPKIQRNIMVFTAIFFLSTSIFLTKYFSTTGLCSAYLMATFIYFLLSFLFIKKYLKIEVFAGDTLKIIFSTLLISAALLVLYNFIQTVLMVILVCIPVGLLYLLLLYFVKFYRIEDVRILDFFGKRIPVIGKLFLIMAKIIRKS